VTIIPSFANYLHRMLVISIFCPSALSPRFAVLLLGLPVDKSRDRTSRIRYNSPDTAIGEASKSGKNQHCSRGLTFHHEYAGLLAGRAGFLIYLSLDAIIPM
jgi:hypothetical protein